MRLLYQLQVGILSAFWVLPLWAQVPSETGRPAGEPPKQSLQEGEGEYRETLYSLPYEPGVSYQVGQGYLEFPTHENLYAVDWTMPEESPIHAARSGVVIEAVDSFYKSGLTEEMKTKANYLVIRHDDGSRAHYYHLAQDGIKVKVGQKVKEGEFIALSGNTGYSATPHLHFYIDRLENGRSVSFPVRYKSGLSKPFQIAPGGKYRAPGGEEPADEGPLQGVQGTGELATIRPRLIALVEEAKTPEQAAIALKKHLLANRSAYKKLYKEVFARSQKGEKSAMKELQLFLKDMDLQSQPAVANLIADPEAGGMAQEAVGIWWELYSM